jgi:hypothetical protein
MPGQDEEQLARTFVDAVRKDLGDFLCAAALFGSCATNHATKLSDIDVLLIIDDVANVVTQELTESYQLVVRGNATKTSPRLHVNTLKLSSFWEYCREGDPVIVNMLRDGHVLLDRGFFAPAQLLLQQGRIRPSKEAVWTYYARAGTTMRSARKHILSACVDLYWAAMDASHAALMSVGEVPPSPEHVPDLLERKLVSRKLLASHYPKLMGELYHLQKAIAHREVKEISGEQYEGYWKETLRLVDALRTVVERHPPAP